MSIPTELAIGTMATEIGELCIVAVPRGVSAVFFEGRSPHLARDTAAGDERAEAMLAQARAELAAYFAGTLRQFTVPCVLGGTPFQNSIWEALRAIPFGEVVSYRTIAERVGNAKAVRAVGAANGQNPVPIIIPCHRVIGSDGSLTGFGGGLPRKQWLLAHEGAASNLLI